tara:strand:- start:47 stop:523 length:477 start_codon:yes stop_codon:yes gene_type:complete
MYFLLNRKKFYFLILIYSIISILYAIYVEYYLGFEPCKLCLFQRVPFVMAMIISIIGITFNKNSYILILLLTVFIISSLFSGYHFGIENNFFNEILGCTSNNLDEINKIEILKSLNTMPNDCKDVNYRVFGQSLSSLNFLSSFIISILCLIILIYEKK